MIYETLQPEFRPAVEQAMKASVERLRPDLAAVYLSGSVAWGEAWPGASDVDWFVFLDRDPLDEDERWAKDLAEGLAKTHSAVAEFGFHLNSVDRLRREQIWRFILRHNSRRLEGRDLITELEEDGIETPAPDRELARSRIGWLERLVKATEEGRFSEAVIKLPDDPGLATRKLARWLILVEGAHVLMADGGFVSFRQDAVLDQLEKLYPQWGPVIETTRRVLQDPTAAGVKPEEFSRNSADFLRWGIAHIKQSGRD